MYIYVIYVHIIDNNSFSNVSIKAFSQCPSRKNWSIPPKKRWTQHPWPYVLFFVWSTFLNFSEFFLNPLQLTRPGAGSVEAQAFWVSAPQRRQPVDFLGKLAVELRLNNQKTHRNNVENKKLVSYFRYGHLMTFGCDTEMSKRGASTPWVILLSLAQAQRPSNCEKST